MFKYRMDGALVDVNAYSSAFRERRRRRQTKKKSHSLCVKESPTEQVKHGKLFFSGEINSRIEKLVSLFLVLGEIKNFILRSDVHLG